MARKSAGANGSERKVLIICKAFWAYKRTISQENTFYLIQRKEICSRCQRKKELRIIGENRKPKSSAV